MLFRYEGRHFKRLARTGRLESPSEGSMLCEIFHENSKITPLSAPAARAEIALFDRAAKVARVQRTPRKIHSLGDAVELPDLGPPETALEQVIADRRSVRMFSGEAITRRELARLMRYSYGVMPPRPGHRAVPSGGALYPLELYAVAWNVEGLEPAVYHYDPPAHRLDVVARGDVLPSLSRCLWLDDVDAEGAALAVVITAFFVRSTIKYRERGYRMILMEAGEVAQNLSLLATEMGLATCILGGFLDNDLSSLLGADGFSEVALLPMIVGRGRQEAATDRMDSSTSSEKGG
jgi:SagB-type dehydrogenase family enzyme